MTNFATAWKSPEGQILAYRWDDEGAQPHYIQFMLRGTKGQVAYTSRWAEPWKADEFWNKLCSDAATKTLIEKSLIRLYDQL